MLADLKKLHFYRLWQLLVMIAHHCLSPGHMRACVEVSVWVWGVDAALCERLDLGIALA
jgi:hypothetical protein